MRLSEDEYDVIADAARRTGLTTAGYAAQAAGAAARAVEPPTAAPLRDALAELIQARSQVRRFGVNVNQAVAALNATGEAPETLGAAVGITSRAVARLDAAAADVARRMRASQP